MSARKPQDHKPPRARAKPKPKLRLVKMLVQPVFVLDHGTHLQDIAEEAREIPAADWPQYSGETFPAQLAEAQRAVDEQWQGKSDAA